ncbi:hypothetical protein [Seonamhaeicola sp. ML3]|uniref:hypothetical protein n=1 Tax=Seonamhaeicola sp. ML3 TaxID=2937786 RepID=UPI00200E32F0|nr:hypothetical protein [Seonamhaeicola sp. ML3]
MKIINKVMIIVLILISNITIGQNGTTQDKNIFTKIELLVRHSRKIIDKEVHITIFNRPEPKKSEIFVWTTDADKETSVKPDFRIKISKDEYSQIEKLIHSIDIDSFVKFENRIGVDGYECQLTYGDSMSSISLNAWSPSSNTEERQLQTYLKVCNMILKAAKKEEL